MLREIKDRRSVRKYIGRDVSHEQILALLKSAQAAPSGSNTQPWRFVVVRDRVTKEAIAKINHGQSWMIGAPVFLVCVADIGCRTNTNNLLLDETSSQEELKKIIRDTSFAIDHILLEAEHMGLGTCCTAWFRQAEIRPILAIPSDKYVCAIITVGYSAEAPPPRARQDLSSIIYYERWGTRNGKESSELEGNDAIL